MGQGFGARLSAVLILSSTIVHTFCANITIMTSLIVVVTAIFGIVLIVHTMYG